MFDFSSPVARVRTIGRIEGVSFLVLLGIAMPLKHLADRPMAVTYVGWAHGVLFIGLALVTLMALLDKQLSFKQCCMVAIASLLPFGPFFIDRRLAGTEAGDADAQPDNA
jgi:integral membrane protein